MANEATIEPTRASVRGEGEALVLEMDSLKDIKFLNRQLYEFGIRHLKRVNRYLELLDDVVEATDDERIVVAAASVAVNALKAVTTALKAEAVNITQNSVHIHGRELPELSRDDLLAIRKLASDAQAQAGQGGEAGTQERPDDYACEDQ